MTTEQNTPTVSGPVERRAMRIRRYNVIYISIFGSICTEMIGARSYEHVHDIFYSLFNLCNLLEIKDA